MGVTIKDIARKLGVSTTTVSLVLNNKPSRISPETRQAVLQAAAELNYHPNQIAVSMVTRRTGTIGLLLPDISNLYFSSLAKVIESECSALGYNVLYGNTNDSVENDFKYLELFLLGRAVDAVILTPSYQLGEEERIRFRGLVESSSIPVVTVDRRMLEELCYNLLENAVKYNRPGGWAKLEVRPEGDSAVLTVSDNGIGIPQEYQQRIFERFYRVDKSRSKQTGGTGLGLSIVKHIVERHGGAVRLQSEPGEGTSITVRLPQKPV